MFRVLQVAKISEFSDFKDISRILLWLDLHNSLKDIYLFDKNT